MTSIRQIVPDPAGVFTVAEGGVGLTTRNGVPRLRLTTPAMEQLQCAIDSGQNKYLLAGLQNKMLIVDTERGKVIKEIETESHTAVLRRSRLVVCGAPSGEVLFRDPRSFDIEHRLTAHTAGLSDIDVTGYYLATCGYSQRGNAYIPDPYVKMYDMRMFRPLAPAQFPAGPFLLKFHPRFTSTLVVASQMGTMQLFDVTKSVPPLTLYQVESQGGFITSMDVSPSGEMMLFTDAHGYVHQWTNNDEARATQYGDDPPPLPSPPLMPAIPMDDSTPLNIIGTPHYTELLLSAWPQNMVFAVGEKPVQVEPEILQAAKKMDFVGYAPNILKLKPNQVTKKASAAADAERPKFRSQQERDGTSEPSSELQESALTATPAKQTVPKHYRRVEIMYSKLGVEDFDFGYVHCACVNGELTLA